MQSKEKNLWEDKLRDFEEKSVELREKTKQLEEEIKGIEGSLYNKNMVSYKKSLLNTAKKTFIKTFRQRDELPPNSEAKEEWDRFTNMLSACITVIKSADTEEAGVCGGVEELKEYLKKEIEAEAELSAQEIASLLGN